jgi:hemoglobin-like flavoprotein
MPISDAAASLFYDRLFEMDPSVRPLFKSDMAQQKKKLMQTLSVAVDGLSNIPRLVPVLEQLGSRHAGYMVQDHHYDLVGEALLWTLREGLGDSFNPEVQSAWTEVYGLVASVMKKAAATSTSAKPQVSTSQPALPPRPPSPPPVEAEDIDMGSLVTYPSLPQPFPDGGETIPYHVLAQSRLADLQPYAQPPPTAEPSAPAAPIGVAAPSAPAAPIGVAAPSAPAAPIGIATPSAPATPAAPAAPTASSAPMAAQAPAAAFSIPVNIPREATLNVHLNLKLEADPALRMLGLRPPERPLSAERPSPSRGSVSPMVMVALCVLISFSTVIALGPIGQSLALADWPRLAAPLFTLAALAVGYFWGRGSDRNR